jgi:two-component system phosphate regulon response regulator OmpR
MMQAMPEKQEEISARPHVLVVDDDTRLRDLLKKFLSAQGFLVTVAENVAQARECLGYFHFDGIVLDVMMPGETGLELARSLPAGTPVLMLSALGEAQHRIDGLEAGALDYLSKPFEPRELVLRLKSIMRRSVGASHQVHFGPYSFDKARQKLLRGAEEISLTTAETQLLQALLEQAGTPVSREALASASGHERSVDVQVTRLRKKLDSSAGPSLIRTVRGAGYVIYTDL